MPSTCIFPPMGYPSAGVFLFLCLSPSVSVCLYRSPRVFLSLSAGLCVSLYVSLSLTALSPCLPLSLSLSVYASLCAPVLVCLFVSLFYPKVIYLYTFLCFCL